MKFWWIFNLAIIYDVFYDVFKDVFYDVFNLVFYEDYVRKKDSNLIFSSILLRASLIKRSLKNKLK